jgi:hypothetical protein
MLFKVYEVLDEFKIKQNLTMCKRINNDVTPSVDSEEIEIFLTVHTTGG